MTLDEQHRTCSYCKHLGTFPNEEAFAVHWRGCPIRIQNGYVEMPLEQIPDALKRLRAEARKHALRAAKCLSEAEQLEERLSARPKH